MKKKFRKNEIIIHNGNKFIHLDEDSHTIGNCERIAKQIKELLPDIIMFELPRQKNPFEILNTQRPNQKSENLIKNIKRNSKQARGNFEIIYETIERIWLEKQHQVLLFRFDAPLELTSNCITLPNDWQIEGIVWNYLREKYMTQFINENNDLFIGRKTVIQCHNHHWKNIKFLLKNPSVKMIWKHYFVDFAKSINVETYSIEKMLNILKKNKRDTLLKYWKLMSDLNE
ncbi:MAG: hypothetical protein U9P73_06815 [Candidatus Cloacimonadota bacterium]|nr:hypothetical protein [Candidatus Cloacimonadota bacterium]